MWEGYTTMPFPSLICEKAMVDAESLVNELELQVEIQELKAIGLNEEEIQGYIEFFYDSWVVFSDTSMLN